MSRPKVLVVRDNFPKKAIDLLQTRCELEILSHSSSGSPSMQNIINSVPGKFAILDSKTSIDESVLKAAGFSLKVISTVSMGYDHVDLKAMKKYGVRLGNSCILVDAVAEFTLGLIIATARRFVEANQQIKMGDWTDFKPYWMCGVCLKGSTVGIIGCGKIGTAIAEKLINFKLAQLLYTSRNEKPAVKALGGRLTTIDELMRSSDFVVITAALNDETKFIVNKERIASMKPNAILVNVGRGQLVDQGALVEALREKRIRGAGLDVMSPEPLPIDHPLMSLDNVLLLPHIGSSVSQSDLEEASMEAVQNILAVLDGNPMPNEVFF